MAALRALNGFEPVPPDGPLTYLELWVRPGAFTAEP